MNLEEVTAAISTKFGVCPRLFTVASDSPPVVEHLFRQAEFAYVEAPFPSLFKEQLFTYLSRFCSVPYCMLRHAAFLVGQGNPAGDASSETMTANEVVELLRTPVPTEKEYAEHLNVLKHAIGPLAQFPARYSALEQAIFIAGVALFIHKGPTTEFQIELRRVLGATAFDRISAFLTFVHTAHNWSELHTELEFEPDIVQLVAENPKLGAWLGSYQRDVNEELKSADAAARRNRAKLSTDEAQRIEVLEAYGILDTAPDEVFDSIAQAAADLCETPIALISLIDPSRQWFKSCIGLNLRETSRDIAFCSHAIKTPDFMEVEDVTLDERFRDNPMVMDEPKIRFYAGQPLVTPEGFALGTLCVIDRKPRNLTTTQRDALMRLADVVMAMLEKQRASIASQHLANEHVKGLGEVLEASINEIFMFDESSLRFVHVNQGARSNLGYSMEELSAMTPVDIKPEFTHEKFERVIAPLRTNEKNKIDFTTVHERKDGSTYPVEVHLQRSRYDSTPAFVAIILDITERTQTEEALAQSRLFLESAPDASIIVNDTGKVEVANTRMTTMFGYTPKELRGMPIEQLIPERFRDGHVTHREAFNADPKIRNMGADLELFALTKDGLEIPIEVSLSPIQTGDGILVAAAIRDIAAQRNVAQELRRAKEVAESATATKSRFLAAASHDLRQPLQSIGLYMSVLNRNLEKEQNLDISNKIRNSLNVMGELLDALLDISKLDSGSIAPTKKDFSTKTMFAQLMADNEPHAKEKGLAFECIGEPCVLHSDPALLQRIVENFVSNAIRYTASGSVEVRCECKDGHARIAIRDSGAGIPEEALDTIFEEYFQLDNPVRDRRKGLGLGLSVVKHIARLLDHRLEVKSVLGEGSTFSVYVPLGQAIEEPVEADTPAKAPTQSERTPIVLFVDDDPAIVDATTMLLSVSGFEVHTALNGDKALAHLTNGLRPDIVVSDYRLPGYNGIEVVQRVRQATTNDLPIILMTGDTSAQEIDAANLSHCTVLYKPVDTDRLIVLIKQLTA